MHVAVTQELADRANAHGVELLKALVALCDYMDVRGQVPPEWSEARKLVETVTEKPYPRL